ncbi:hypothetical protein B0H67DRAFT_641701 [Lasiosphaeris hirsuta]|uniref:Uncharacterized protein n=1 Tax=Lasiosphaeris hirsuta TaxID=260670 RepID=A0AA40E326_9PEZI|nr:hypothetical protein B0H67DRAFT_641701 [Lasiosphaeris hirsuta]
MSTNMQLVPAAPEPDRTIFSALDTQAVAAASKVFEEQKGVKPENLAEMLGVFMTRISSLEQQNASIKLEAKQASQRQGMGIGKKAARINLRLNKLEQSVRDVADRIKHGDIRPNARDRDRERSPRRERDSNRRDSDRRDTYRYGAGESYRPKYDGKPDNEAKKSLPRVEEMLNQIMGELGQFRIEIRGNAAGGNEATMTEARDDPDEEIL